MDWIDEVVRDVAELDYNSPVDQPSVMLVKASELRAIIEARAPKRLQTSVGAGDGQTFAVG
jgi:hypothetical protein